MKLFKKTHDELRETSRAELQDIYPPAFDEYLIYLKKSKPNLANLSKERISKLQGFTDNSKPTLAGVML